MTYASTHVIFIHECSQKLFYFRSKGVVGLVLAADVDVTVAEDLGTLYLVLLYILDALRERILGRKRQGATGSFYFTRQNHHW